MVTGNDLLAGALRDLGVKDFFFIMGGPMSDATKLIFGHGIRGIDVRHEQERGRDDGARLQPGHGRGRRRDGLLRAGALNLLTGIATAWADGSPVVALGGSSPSFQNGMGAFQEVDQLAIFRPVTKWSMRLTDPSRIPDTVEEAFTRARSGKPGPVYLTSPPTCSTPACPMARPPRPRKRHVRSTSRSVTWLDIHSPVPGRPEGRSQGSPPARPGGAPHHHQRYRRAVVRGVGRVADPRRSDRHPFLLDAAGTWRHREEDHPLSFLAARSAAFREARRSSCWERG